MPALRAVFVQRVRPIVVQPPARLYAYHLRPHIPQQLYRVRYGDKLPHLNYAYPRQRQSHHTTPAAVSAPSSSGDSPSLPQ